VAKNYISNFVSKQARFANGENFGWKAYRRLFSSIF